MPYPDLTDADWLHITDLEAALNHWCAHLPCAPHQPLPSPIAALAEVYAQMITQRQHRLPALQLPSAALQAWLDWYDTQPDTPCIAICSTSQGDDTCKGCGRSFTEVQHWLSMSPFAKRATWQRIQAEGSALRFTRYAERADRR